MARGIVIGEREVLAVDSQYPSTAAEFRRQIGTVTGKPVNRLLLTHVHADHVFGAQAFADCDIVAQRRLAAKMREYAGTQWSPDGLRAMRQNAPPERAAFFEGVRLTYPKTLFDSEIDLDGVKVYATGGHTDCSCVARAPDGTVFAGDLLFVGRFPFAGDETADPDAWIAGLRRIRDLKPEKIVPGHGPVVGLEEVDKQIKWYREVRGAIMDQITSGVPSWRTSTRADGFAPELV